MNSPPNGSHRGTYDAVFRRPAAHNLQWRDVWSMLGTVADVQEHNGTLKVTRNGQALVLHRPRGKDLADLKELAQVRHFLERSGAAVPPAASPPPAADGTHLLVVIDHREARVYRTELRGSVPQRITPYDPRATGATCTTSRTIPTASGSRSGEASTRRSPPRWRRRAGARVRHRHRGEQREGPVDCRAGAPPPGPRPAGGRVGRGG